MFVIQVKFNFDTWTPFPTHVNISTSYLLTFTNQEEQI